MQRAYQARTDLPYFVQPVGTPGQLGGPIELRCGTCGTLHTIPPARPRATARATREDADIAEREHDHQSVLDDANAHDGRPAPPPVPTARPTEGQGEPADYPPDRKQGTPTARARAKKAERDKGRQR